MKFNEVCVFEQKVLFETLTNSHTPSHFCDLARTEHKKLGLCSKVDFGPIIQIWNQKLIFDARMEFWGENAFLHPHVGDAYKTNGILTKTDAFLAQSRFWSQKCVLDPKIYFWIQKSKNRPKRSFWAQKCVFRKSDQKVKVWLNVAEGEPGSAASGPDRIHGRPGLPELVAFSVPLHSNICISTQKA